MLSVGWLFEYIFIIIAIPSVLIPWIFDDLGPFIHPVPFRPFCSMLCIYVGAPGSKCDKSGSAFVVKRCAVDVCMLVFGKRLHPIKCKIRWWF